MAIIRYGRQSWKPWCLSLAVELASRALARHAPAAFAAAVRALMPPALARVGTRAACC